MREYLLAKWCFIPLVEFQRLEESMPRCSKAVLAAHHLNKTPIISLISHLSVCVNVTHVMGKIIIGVQNCVQFSTNLLAQAAKNISKVS